MRQRICDECNHKYMRALDYRIRTQPVFANHAAYDDTASGSRDRQQARFDSWRTTIKHQQQVIRDACLVNGHLDEQEQAA